MKHIVGLLVAIPLAVAAAAPRLTDAARITIPRQLIAAAVVCGYDSESVLHPGVEPRSGPHGNPDAGSVTRRGNQKDGVNPDRCRGTCGRKATKS